MSIGIDVKGLDEVQKKLKELQEGLTLHALQHWAEEIELEAKDMAAARSTEEVKNSIHIEVVEIEPKTFQVKASAKEEAVPFIAEATRDKLNAMPVTSASIFKTFLGQVEKKLGASQRTE